MFRVSLNVLLKCARLLRKWYSLLPMLRVILGLKASTSTLSGLVKTWMIIASRGHAAVVLEKGVSNFLVTLTGRLLILFSVARRRNAFLGASMEEHAGHYQVYPTADRVQMFSHKRSGLKLI